MPGMIGVDWRVWPSSLGSGAQARWKTGSKGRTHTHSHAPRRSLTNHAWNHPPLPMFMVLHSSSLTLQAHPPSTSPTLHPLPLPQRITYAKTKSDAVAKVDGTYKPDKKSRAQKNAAARGKGGRREGGSGADARGRGLGTVREGGMAIP